MNITKQSKKSIIKERCPVCKSDNLAVKDSRVHIRKLPIIADKITIRRRRIKCEHCEYKWNTIEVSDNYFKQINEYVEREIIPILTQIDYKLRGMK